jgi:hypothetical protein
MTRITLHGKQALDVLVEKHTALKVASVMFEKELKDQLEEKLASFKRERDIALRLADEAGVPRTKIGKALGTTNYRTVQDILNETEGLTLTAEDLEATSTGTVTDTWSVTWVEEDLAHVEVRNLGPTNINGWVEVTISDGDMTYKSGDEFVIPALYRAGVVNDIVNSR